MVCKKFFEEQEEPLLLAYDGKEYSFTIKMLAAYKLWDDLWQKVVDSGAKTSGLQIELDRLKPITDQAVELYRCPISGLIMETPVIHVMGQICERDEIQKRWLEHFI